ncbi:glycosyltransferase [Weeksella virosa]|nr:glycosyltransferase [Weeksella virosa]MDK7674254.1 glycosyltransferase [Weeksella virosa]
MKKFFVIDWLDKYGGAERVIASLESIFDFDAYYTLVNVMNENDWKKITTQKKPVTTTAIQKLGTSFRYFFPFFHRAIENIHLPDEKALVISSSHAVAKGIKTKSNQLHISYFQARNFKYIWDEQALYFGKLRGVLQPLISYLQKKDYAQAQRPDYIISNSFYVQNWVKEVYHRDSEVIYPPVDLDNFQLEVNANREDYYVTVGRLVPYKRFDIIVEAFNASGKKLIIIGDGVELKKLQKLAKKNIHFTGYLQSEEINQYICRAKGFIHVGIEDFGIAPVEAQACGTPVVAYAVGGARETVLDGITGKLFDEQNKNSLNLCIAEFEKLTFDPEVIRQHALKFSRENFEQKMKAYVADKLSRFG